MSNFNRKLKRSVAKAQGLPKGFYCNVMQNKLRMMNAKIQNLNKLIEESREDIVQVNELANALIDLNNSEMLASEEKVPDGEESNA